MCIPYSPPYVAKKPSSATIEATNLKQFTDKLYQMSHIVKYKQYSNMYMQAIKFVDLIQKYRSIDRTAILLGSIHDTGNPAGTAINLALNAKTIADKKISKKAMTEWSKKALNALNT